MSRRTILCQHDPLGDRLRREARQTRPRFSEVVHERVAAAIQERRERRAAQSHVPPSSWIPQIVGRSHGRLGHGGRWLTSSRRVLAVVAAACLLYVVVGVGWQWMGRLSADHPAQFGTVENGVADKAGPAAVATVKRDLSAHAAETRLARLPVKNQWPRQAVRHRDALPQSAAISPNLDHLVYDDARRAARVLLNRLPIDLALADLALIDE